MQGRSVCQKSPVQPARQSTNIQCRHTIALSSILPQLKACRRTAGLFSWLKVAPSAHIGGFAPYNPQYIAKKHSAGGRGRVRQHPTPFPLPFGEGVRGWGKFKLTNTFLTSSEHPALMRGVFVFLERIQKIQQHCKFLLVIPEKLCYNKRVCII